MSRTLDDLVRVEDHGTLVLVRPLEESAKEWLEENTDGTWFGGALVVEPRYVGDLLTGLWTNLVPLFPEGMF